MRLGSAIFKSEVDYDTAGRYQEVLDLWDQLKLTIPVDWQDQSMIKRFKIAADSYAKAYSRLSWADQGRVSEEISRNTTDGPG